VHHHRHSHVVEHPSLQQRHPPDSSAGLPINLIVTYRISATSCSANAAPADAAAMMSCPTSNPRDTIRHLGGTAMLIEGEVGLSVDGAGQLCKPSAGRSTAAAGAAAGALSQ
jgi:hypothetical protein